MSKTRADQPVADHTKAVFSRPEHELLIYSARSQPNDQTKQRIAVLVQEDLDWNYVIQLARQHWVAPLLYLNVKEVGDSEVPTFAMEWLRDYARQNAKHNLFLTVELVKLLELFAASQIRALPYKGPALAHVAYGNIALRPFSDLDVLIDPQDVDEVEQQLRSLDYVPYEQLDGTKKRIRLLSNYESVFINRSSAATLEIHWAAWKKDLAPTPSQSDLWGRASVVTLLGKTIAIPSPEDMLLLSSIHGTKHLWQKLQLICDIAELIRAHPAMNWHLLIARARKLGNERILLVGLLLASDLFASAIPECIEQKARGDGTVVYLTALIERQLFQDRQDSTEDLEFGRGVQISDLPFFLRSKERLADQARLVLAQLTLPTLADYEAVPLPLPLIGLYLLIHPTLIIKRYMHTVWG